MQTARDAAFCGPALGLSVGRNFFPLLDLRCSSLICERERVGDHMVTFPCLFYLLILSITTNADSSSLSFAERMEGVTSFANLLATRSVPGADHFLIQERALITRLPTILPLQLS